MSGLRWPTKAVTQFVREAEAEGWTATKTAGGHVKFTHGSHVVFGPSTPSDHRSLLNVRAQMRRALRGVLGPFGKGATECT